MKVFIENDVVRLQETIEVDVIGEGRTLFAQEGLIGTIVLVHGDPAEPLAYEIEFFIPVQSCYALATVDASLVTAA